MKKCEGCGLVYLHFNKLCPACRKKKDRDNPLNGIDNGIDLDGEQDQIHKEIQDQQDREFPKR